MIHGDARNARTLVPLPKESIFEVSKYKLRLEK